MGNKKAPDDLSGARMLRSFYGFSASSVATHVVALRAPRYYLIVKPLRNLRQLAAVDADVRELGQLVDQLRTDQQPRSAHVHQRHLLDHAVVDD